MLAVTYPQGGVARYTYSSDLQLVLAERTANVHVHAGVSEDDFVAMRTQRDATLDMPRLILPSIQVNIRAGHLPEAEDNGTQYLKLPLNTL